MKRVAFCTFGCRLNAYDTETVRTLLETEGGWSTVGLKEQAEVYVVNTCSVTTQADARARNAIRRLKREHPEASIVVTGCYAQRAPEEIAAIPGVSLIVGAADRASIAKVLDDVTPDSLKVAVSPIDEAKEFIEVSITEMMERSRALVKVQEGCDKACTFCIVPQTRGRSRSRHPARVLDQVHALVEKGYSEIVLTGVHIGSYGLDVVGEQTNLTDLIQKILAVPDLQRFRLSSIEPASVSDELIELMASEAKFAHHFHIPFQSASDRVLERMQRGYTRRSFEQLVERITQKVSNCGLGTDVIAGFPGESDEDFQQTFDCLTQLPVTYLHPFTYSVRPGSSAEMFGDQVPPDVKKRRTRSLKRLSKDKNRVFREAQVGTLMPVLFEADERKGQCRAGHTENFVKVRVDSDQHPGAIRMVRINALSDDGLLAKVIANDVGN